MGCSYSENHKYRASTDILGSHHRMDVWCPQHHDCKHRWGCHGCKDVVPSQCPHSALTVPSRYPHGTLTVHAQHTHPPVPLSLHSKTTAANTRSPPSAPGTRPSLSPLKLVGANTMPRSVLQPSPSVLGGWMVLTKPPLTTQPGEPQFPHRPADMTHPS